MKTSFKSYFGSFSFIIKILSKHQVGKEVVDAQLLFEKINERDMFPPEFLNMKFAMFYIAVIKESRTRVPDVFPIYVYESVAETLLDFNPSYFENLNVQIIENNW